MIRQALKRSLKKVLGRGDDAGDAGPVPYPFKYEPGQPRRSAPEPASEERGDFAVMMDQDAPAEEDAPAAPAAPAAPEEAPAAPAEPEAAPAEGVSVEAEGIGLTLEAVQELLDDMVRPALQADGGDIALIKIEGVDVYVKLVGSCSTCPSSIMTMKAGVEALFKEEFPGMGELIQVG